MVAKKFCIVCDSLMPWEGSRCQKCGNQFLPIDELIDYILFEDNRRHVRHPVAFTLSEGSWVVLQETKCAICTLELELGEELVRLPCEHIFHERCIIGWSEDHDHCPLCRRRLRHRNIQVTDAANANSSMDIQVSQSSA